MATMPVAIDARKAKTGAAQAEQAFDKTTKAAKKTDQQVNKLDKNLTKTGKTAGKMKKMLVAAFAGLSAFMVLRDVTNTVTNFGQEMSTLEAVTGASEDTMKSFEDQARSLGATTRFSATEAAEGMTFLARAGFDANETLAAISGTLDLATAGALELGEAADIASNVLSQFNLSAEETGKVGDILVKTANSANTNVAQLAEAMKMAGPVAGALNISLEETAASIGVLGDAGIQASLAGTNLRGIMAGLLGPTSAAQKAIEGMGLTVEELDPSTNSLADIFDKLAMHSLTAGDAVEIFGRRNAAAALVIAGSTDKLKELTLANMDAENTAKEAAKIMADNLAGSFKTLRSAVEEAYLQVGDAGFTGGLRGMVDTATGALRILLDLEMSTGDVTAGAKGLAAAIRGVTTGLIALIALKTILFVKSLAVGVTTLTGAMQALRTAMIAHPILALGTVIAAASITIAAFVGTTEDATESLKVMRVTVGGFNKEIEQFNALQKQVEKGRLFGRAGEEAQGLKDQIGVLEDVLINLQKTAEKEGGDAFTNFFDLTQVGVTMDDFRANLDDLGTFFQDWAKGAGASAQIGILPLADAIKLVEAELKQMADTAVEAGKVAGDAGTEDDIQTRIDQAVAVKDAREALEGQIQALKDERELLRASDEYREIILARRKAEAEAIGLSDKERKEYLTTIEDEIKKNQDLVASQEARAAAVEKENEVIEARAAAKQSIDAYIDSIRQEAEAVRMTAEERELSEAIRSTELALVGETKEEIDLYTAAVRSEIEALQAARMAQEDEQEAKAEAARLAREAQREREAEARENERLAEMWAAPFVNALGDIITGSSSAEDALKNLYKSISNMALQQLALGPLQNLLGGGLQSAFFSGGGIFRHGTEIVPNAAGSIVSSPTPFQMSTSNRVGMMGEAGPEAIVPLATGPGGKLGVEAVGGGGGGGGGPVNQTVNQYISTPDSDSFRRSRRQIAQDAKRGLG